MTATRPLENGSRPWRPARRSISAGVVAAAIRAASSFDSREREPLEVRRGHGHPHAVERVREPVREAALSKERDQLHNRASARLEVAVVFLRQVPHEHVQRDPLGFELRRDLDGEECVGEVRNPQRALERVAIRDGHEAHPALLAHAVHTLGIGVRLAELRATKGVVPAVGGVARVHVQIAARHYLPVWRRSDASCRSEAVVTDLQLSIHHALAVVSDSAEDGV